MIRKLELHLKKPLAHLICLYHCNELPLRHLFEFLDGPTRGPNSLAGEIGSHLGGDLCSLPVINFSRVRGLVQHPGSKVVNNLSSDQQYLLNLSLVVQGDMTFLDNPCVVTASPGALNNSRWLTRANRVLRLYISTESPSSALRRLVHIIVNSYAPCWFFLKTHSNFLDGPLCFHYLTSSLNSCLTKEEKAIVQPVLDRNSFFGHSENVLVAMLVHRSTLEF